MLLYFFRPNFLLAEKPLKEKILMRIFGRCCSRGIAWVAVVYVETRLLRWPFLTTLAFVCPHRCYNHNENNDSPPEILG